ncbi:MAG: hypothetical protein ACRERD_06245 [Candidatus Binatia bacterium]
MKSVYVDDVLHQKLKNLAREHHQTLIALLNRFAQEGIERMEKNRRRPRSAGQDLVGMFGRRGHQEREIEQGYAESRYQGGGERDGRF